MHGKGDRAYIRFSDIRDASMVHQNIHIGREDWEVQYVSPNDFNQVCETPIYELLLPTYDNRQCCLARDSPALTKDNLQL